METNRSELLKEAARLVDGDRNADYGDPIQDFSRTGKYWGIHLSSLFSRRMHYTGKDPDGLVPISYVESMLEDLIEPHDVAIMMMQLKHSRLAWSPHKRDHWADCAGYAACGWDCEVRENDAY